MFGIAKGIVIITAMFFPVLSRAGETTTRGHYGDGLKHYNLGEFEPALRAFREAYRMTQDPAMLFNIGQCQYKLGDLQGALHSFRAYLRSSTNLKRRAEVENRVTELERRLQPRSGTDPPAQKPATDGNKGPLLLAKPMIATKEPREILRANPDAARTSHRADSPAYTRWWFWTAAGVVVLGGAGLFLTVRRADEVPASALGSRPLK